MSTATAPEVERDEFSEFAEGYDSKAMEERMKSGGNVPEGKYEATLAGAQRTESKQKGTPGWELVFTISAGPFKGSEIRDTLFITDNSKSKDRLALFGHRLGLLERTGPEGKALTKVKGKTNFQDVLDTPCVIEVIHEPDQHNAAKKWPRLAFGGIWNIGHPDLKKDPPKNGTGQQTKPAAAATGTKPADGDKTGTDAKKKVGRGEL